MNLLNLFDILDTVSAEKRAETPAGIPPAVQVSQADGQPATIVVPVATTDEVEVLEDDHEDSLELGDEVIITGNVQYQGKTGRIVDFGRNKHFLIVDLYNFGKHSFHSSNVAPNDYADSEEEDADWRERDHGLFGDDERDEDLNEGFGAYYYEQLAQKVFDLNPNLSTEGRCEELLKAAFPIAVQDLGKKGAQWKFNYDEDFPSDFVSAYAYLQGDGEQGVAEGLRLRGTGNPGMTTPYDQGREDAKKGRSYDNPYDQPGEENEHSEYKKGYQHGKTQGVAEGIGKSIKRGLQGWRKGDNPKEIRRLAKDADDADIKGASRIHTYIDNTFGSSSEHSPVGFNRKVIDREMKKRGLGEQGVAEGSEPVKPITPAAKKYHKEHKWVLNGNVPGAFKRHYDTIAKLNKQGVAEGSEEGLDPKTRLAIKVIQQNKRRNEPVAYTHAVKHLKTQGWSDRQIKNLEQGVAEGEESMTAFMRKFGTKANPVPKKPADWDQVSLNPKAKQATKKKQQGVAEGRTTPVKHNGEVIGHVWKNPQGYVSRHIKTGDKYDGNDKESVVHALINRHNDLKQGVAEGEYDDPRWEPREPDMSRKVDWDIEAQRNAPEESEPEMTVTVCDAEGNVVLTFPSTGGFYGDKKYAASKGFDTESGDYTIKWKRDTNEGNNWLDVPVSEEFDRIKKLAGLK